MFSARRVPGEEVARRPPLRCAAKLQKRPTRAASASGDGRRTRSFLFISECIEGTVRLMRSDVPGPLNIGSDEMVTIDRLADLIIDISGKTLRKNYIPGPIGVRGRNSDSRRIRKALGWAPSKSLRRGLERTYAWIEMQVSGKRQ